MEDKDQAKLGHESTPNHLNSDAFGVQPQTTSTPLNAEGGFISLAQASQLSNYHPDYLGYLARTGKLEAQKIGRNWVTSITAIEKLIASGNGRSEVMDETGKKIPVHVIKETENVPNVQESLVEYTTPWNNKLVQTEKLAELNPEKKNILSRLNKFWAKKEKAVLPANDLLVAPTASASEMRQPADNEFKDQVLGRLDELHSKIEKISTPTAQEIVTNESEERIHSRPKRKLGLSPAAALIIIMSFGVASASGLIYITSSQLSEISESISSPQYILLHRSAQQIDSPETGASVADPIAPTIINNNQIIGRGERGLVGTEGSKGDKGDRGERGEAGPQGPAGVQGPAGPAGSGGQTVLIPTSPSNPNSGGTLSSATIFSAKQLNTETLTVTSDINQLGGHTTLKDTTIQGSLLVTGSTTTLSDLNVTGSATFGGALNIGAASTFTGTITSNGQLIATRVPSAAHMFAPSWPLGTSNVSDSSLYINPASSVADGNLIGAAVNGDVKFLVDAEGDIYGNNLVLAGSTTTGATTIAGSLSVQDNTTLGDAASDTITFNGNANTNLTFTKADPSIIFNTLTATDTDFWLGTQEDAGGDDDDTFQIGKGTTVGTRPALSMQVPGTDSVLLLHSGVTHGVTDVVPTDIVGRFYGGGGLNVLGLNGPSSTTTSPVSVTAIVNDGTLTTPAVRITGLRKLNAGVQEIPAAGRIFSVFSFEGFSNVEKFTVFGNGDTKISNGSVLGWLSRSLFSSPSDGQINITNAAASAGVGLDFATDGTLKIRTKAQNADAALMALTGSFTGAGNSYFTGSLGVGTTSPSGKLDIRDGLLNLSDSDVTHGTTVVRPTNVYGGLEANSGTAGGMSVLGISDTDTASVGLALDGIIGTQSATVPAVQISGYRPNGTGVGAIGINNKLLAIQNFQSSVFNGAPYQDEVLTILGSGNVGIGTTIPGAPLHVVRAADNDIAKFVGSSSGLRIQSNVSGSSVDIIAHNAADTAAKGLYLRGFASTGVYIDTTGNVGIGTTIPGAKLEVAAAAGGIYLSDGSVTRLKFFESRSAELTNDVAAAIYYAAGSSTYPFNTSGNLIIQPRTSLSRDIVLMTGSTTPLPRLVVQGGGNVGIGSSTPTHILEVEKTLTTFGGSHQIGAANTLRVALAAEESNAVSAFRSEYITTGARHSGSSFGVVGASTNNSVNNLSEAYGVKGEVTTNNTGDITAAVGLTSTVRALNGNMLAAYGIGQITIQADAGRTITNSYGIRLANSQGAGTITNNYGLYIDNQTKGGTLNYAIYSEGGQSYHAGNFGIGTTTVGARLDIDIPNASSITVEQITLRSANTVQTLTSGTTISEWKNNQFIAPTLNGVNGGAAETVTTAATLYVDAAPSGTDITITNPYAMWVDAGQSRFDGVVSMNTASTTFHNGIKTAPLMINSGSRGLYVSDNFAQSEQGAASAFIGGSNGILLAYQTTGSSPDVRTAIAGAMNAVADANTASFGLAYQAQITGYGIGYHEYSDVSNKGGGTIPYVKGLRIDGRMQGASDTITNLYGIEIDPFDSVAGTITNQYGVYVGISNQATNNWGIYQSNSAVPNYFAGNVGIGAISPEALLEVQGIEGTDAGFVLDADDGDDNADTWWVKSQAADNDLVFLNHTTESMRMNDNGTITTTSKLGVGTTIIDSDAIFTVGAGAGNPFKISSTGRVAIGTGIVDQSAIYIGSTLSGADPKVFITNSALLPTTGTTARGFQGSVTVTPPVAGTVSVAAGIDITDLRVMDAAGTVTDVVGIKVGSFTAKGASATVTNEYSAMFASPTNGSNNRITTVIGSAPAGPLTAGLYISGAPSGNNALIVNSGNVGIGTTGPSAKLHTLSTTEQLRLGYDASNFGQFTVSSTGVITVQYNGGGGGWIFDGPASTFRPTSNGAQNFGSGAIRWGTLYGISSDISTTLGVGTMLGIGVTANPSFPFHLTGATYTATVNSSAYEAFIGGTITEAGSGTHPLIASLRLDAPTINAGAAAVTNTASLYISDAPSASGATNYSLWVDAGSVRLDGSLEVQSSGPHIFGGSLNPATSIQFDILGTWAPSAGTAQGIRLASSISAVATDSAYGIATNPTFVEAGSGNHALFANLRAGISTVTGGAATVSNTASFYVEGAMSATVSGQNYSLWVDAGNSRFDGNVAIGTTNPTVPFHLEASAPTTDYVARIINTQGTRALGMLIQTNTASATASDPLLQVTGGADVRFKVETGGNVGIGTTTPNRVLELQASLPLLRLNRANLYGWDIGVDNGTYSGTSDFIVRDDTLATVRLVIKQSTGNVGIGTTGPGTRLHTLDNTTSGPLGITIENDGATTSNLLMFRIISEVGGANNVKFSIDSDGDLLTDGSTTIGTPADVAEMYPTLDSDLSAGHVVSISTGLVPLDNSEEAGSNTSIAGLIKASGTNTVLGIVSTEPGLILAGYTENSKPVALVGRVPVKVTEENGSIAPGDRLTVSGTLPGYAMKLTESGNSIGVALESSSSGVDQILMFVNLSYQRINIAQNGSKIIYDKDIDMAGHSIENVKAIASLNGKWAIGEDGIITAVKLAVDEIETKKLKIAGTTTSTIGRSSIITGSTYRTISNENVTDTSTILVTFRGDYSGRYWIEDQGDGQFTVKLSAPVAQEVPFDYWIVDTDQAQLTPQAPVPQPQPEPDPEPEPEPQPDPEPEPEPEPEP